MDFELAAPRASALVESLRGVGYSTATALADLIDNSISANAQNVWLKFQFAGTDSWISILDDGVGMSEETLRQAMVLGATPAGNNRSAGDLGRFGLGLKTASFSQCRCLTVGSRKDSQSSVRRWDLDYISRLGADEWRLLYDPRSGSETLLEPLSELSSGTLVLWEVLDRLTAGTKSDDRKAEDAFHEMIEGVEDHIAMVFHRFLEGAKPGLRLFINGRRVKSWDPFLSSHPATEQTPPESIPASKGRVELQGFVLPHKDRLSEDENRRGGGSNGWAAQQGFYIYRSNRLLVSGGWLGLGSPRPWTMEEPFRLARLRVEFDNQSDEAWDIDIKKSVARPPRPLRPRMTELAQVVREKARRVFAHRGSYGPRGATVDLVPAWENRTTAGGYRINRKHPVVAAALQGTGGGAVAIEAAIKLIEATVPVERIWLDTAEQGEVVQTCEEEEVTPDLIEIGQSLVRHWTLKIGLSPQQALAKLSSTDPFQNHPRTVEHVGKHLLEGNPAK